MLNDIYNKKILELAGNTPVFERLESCDASCTKQSKLCGSKVSVDLNFDGDVVSAYAHDVKACMLGQAACAIMAAHIVGSDFAELKQLNGEVRAMLKDDGASPTGKWADIAALQPVKDVKARHASTLLVFEAVCEAIDRYQGDDKAMT